jgi:ABC-type taurine transport system substrate-binding protein
LRTNVRQVVVGQRQKILWDALASYVRRHNGWVVSQPDVSPIRFECAPTATLPEILRQQGYEVREAGTAERLLPVTEMVAQSATRTVARQHVEPTMIAVFELDMPVIADSSAK